ncbi:hypothetical protein [Streptomyces sp. NPDC050704]|uniref:hypothetical protein n=1 Tax=Streptomyces sp. NPDC050704 TaxID=3157219 RepID=UPI0034168285
MPFTASRVALGIATAVLVIAGTAVAVQADGDSGPKVVGTPTSSGRPGGADPTSTRAELPAATVKAARETEADALRGTGLRTPSGWDIVDVRTERHNDRDVTVIRRQPDGYRLGGPHASVVVDDNGTLLGFTSLDDRLAGADLPGADRSEWTALRFLRHAAPDHVDGLDVDWVDPHSEKVVRADGSTATVAGTKVKMHHENGLYTWVVIAPDGDVLTYERGIAWDLDQGRRGTQMWLHDSWIAAHDGTGPQPEAPYAPVRLSAPSGTS